MSNSKPAPTGYGSLMNFTSLPQRFPGLLVDKGYIGEEELKELGLYEEREFNGVNRFYAGFARIFENEGLLEDADEILEDKGFRNAVQKTVLRAGLRKELNEG